MFNGNNICKFNFSRSSDLVCDKFIYETTSTQKVPRIADTYVLALVVNGSGKLCINGKSYSVSEGDLYLVAKGDVFSVESDELLEYTYISFDGKRAKELTDRIDHDLAQRIFNGCDELTEFWLVCLKKSDNGNIDLFSEAVLLYSFAHFATRSVDRSDPVTKLIRHTDENFTNSSLSLSSAAEKLKYDPKYLSTRFKKELGVPYTEYLRNMRIRHAAFLFEQGIISIKNVAILSGFKDAMYFSRLFKREFGMTPSEYMLRISGEDE